MKSLLSRLAREVKVVRVSGIVSGFRGCGLRRSPGSAELHRAAFPPRNWGQWLARNFSRLTVARRRRFCTVFPARSLRSMWRSVAAFRHGRDAALLRLNDLAERPKWSAPRLLRNVLA